MVWCEGVTENGNLLDEVFARARLDRSLFQVEQKTVNNSIHIDIVCHLIEQVESLNFESVISILKTVNNQSLILKRILWVNFNDAGQSSDTNVFQVM